MRNLSKIMIFSIIFLGIITLVSLSVNAEDTVTVGPGGAPTYDFDNINDAITNANAGDTIQVYSGTYSENIVIDKTLSMTSVDGRGSTTIISAASNQNTIEINANNVNISGFTIKNLGGNFFGIKFNTVSGCLISNNLIENGGNGVYLYRSNSNTIDNNIVEDNNVGIYFSNSDINTIKNNYIQNNNQNGVFLASTSSGNTFYLNDFSNNDGNAYDLGSNNWDYGSQGNYWDDYNDYDSDGNGKGDNPYFIEPASNRDNYPLGDFLGLGERPVAYIDSISPNPAGQGKTVSFIGHGTPNDDVVAWEWKSDGDTISNTATFSTSSLSSGTHTISFRVQDNDGDWSEYVVSTLVINPNQKPMAFILKPNQSETFTYGEAILFLGYGIDPDGQIAGYMWRSEPEGVTSIEASFNNSDLPVGNYTIYFKVRDNYGDWSSETALTFSIQSDYAENQEPITDAGGPYTGVVNQSITFDGSKSYDPDEGDSINYTWDFGDGETGYGVSPTHKYTSEGNYTIELTVLDTHGEQAISTTYIVIALKTDDQNGDQGIPGFEIIVLALALTLVVIWIKFKRKRF